MRCLAVALVALAAAGCTSGGAEDRSDDGPTPPTSSSQSPGPLLSETEACAEVRAGIDAFNLGDPQETVRHFAKAVPLAKQLVADGEDAGVLLEAIQYYAALPPDEYLSASPSPEFQRNKAITLTLCAYGAGPAEEPTETETGVPA